jgi:hypothetical protein
MLLDCENCSARIDAEVLHSYVVSDDSSLISFRYSLARCPQCSSPLLASQQEGIEEWEAPDLLYPSADSPLSDALPRTIRTAFEEARSCFRAKAYTATAIMCRKTLEGICRAHGIEERTLKGAIAKLREKGVIERSLFEWADALRDSGNEAAHDVNVMVAAQDASDMVEFTHALIEYVFTFQERFEAFKQRRATRRAGA